MLRNKYVAAIVGAALLLVVAYNVAFFKSLPAKHSGTAVKTPVVGMQRQNASVVLPVMNTRPIEEWRRDPFWYPQSTKHATRRTAAPRPASGMQLEATMIRDGKGYAIISGQLVGVGERFGDYVVAEVGDQFVKLRNSGGVKKLSITTDMRVKE